MNTTFSLTPIIAPSSGTIVRPTDVVAPIERVRLFSDEQFESFIAEWAVSCIKPQCKEVYNLGGAGDMGRDVIGEFDDGSYVYYQCKNYDHALAPAEMYVEIGKLCYYTYTGDIPVPTKYYFVAPYDVGPKLLGFIKNPDKFKQELINNWDRKCKKEISDKGEIALDDNLRYYIEHFDFSIFACHTMHAIIEEYRKTDYFFFRFGSPTPPARPAASLPPDKVDPIETRYIEKAKRAYALSKHLDPAKDFCATSGEANSFISSQRKIFYIAESLRQYSRRLYPDGEVFDALKDEVLSAVSDTVEMDYPDPLTRLRTTLTNAASANTTANPLDYELHVVRNDDRKGICHHLVNDSRIDWEGNEDAEPIT